MSKARPRAKERKEDIHLPLLPGQRRDSKLTPKSDALDALMKAPGRFKRLRELLAGQIEKGKATPRRRR